MKFKFDGDDESHYYEIDFRYAWYSKDSLELLVFKYERINSYKVTKEYFRCADKRYFSIKIFKFIDEIMLTDFSNHVKSNIIENFDKFISLSLYV